MSNRKLPVCAALLFVLAGMLGATPASAVTTVKSCPELRLLDPDNDGTIDCRELRSPAGKSLLRLLRK